MAKDFRTRCYYTEYVNHMIRFYITCPDKLMTGGKRGADIANWIAVQDTLHAMNDDDREKIIAIYRAHYNLPKAVDIYCQQTGSDKQAVWVLLTRTAAQVARKRGLV